MAGAIDVSDRAYGLLRWFQRRLDAGDLPPVVVPGTHAADGEAAHDWILAWKRAVPEIVSGVDSAALAKFFGTYLTTSFELLDPPRELAVPGSCGCACPLCLRIVHGRHLEPRRLVRADQRQADQWLVDVVSTLAVGDAGCHLGDRAVARAAAMVAYGGSLVARCRGDSPGPAALVLWRRLAWENGSPNRDFALTADAILGAQRALAGLR